MAQNLRYIICPKCRNEMALKGLYRHMISHGLSPSEASGRVAQLKAKAYSKPPTTEGSYSDKVYGRPANNDPGFLQHSKMILAQRAVEIDGTPFSGAGDGQVVHTADVRRVTISEEGLRLALVGIKRMQADMNREVEDIEAMLNPPVRRGPYKKPQYTEEQLVAIRERAAMARAAKAKKVLLPTTMPNAGIKQEYWPNGEPKYKTNADGSVQVSARTGKPVMKTRQAMLEAAAIRAHVSRGIKPKSWLKKAEELERNAGKTPLHAPINPKHKANGSATVQ